MRYLLAVLAFTFSMVAQGDEVLTVEWNIIGIQDAQASSGVKAVESIRVDVRWGQGPFGVINGMVVLEGGTGVEAVGSCVLYSDSLGCELQVRGAVYALSLDTATGDGEISILGADGVLIEEGAAVMQSI